MFYIANRANTKFNFKKRWGSKGGGSGAILPVITNFAFDAVTQELSFECNTTGTLNWFFDLTASYASGDLAAAAVGSAELSGTMAISEGLFDGVIDDDLLPVGSWYLHIYVSNAAGNSNCESTAYEKVAATLEISYTGQLDATHSGNVLTGTNIAIGDAYSTRRVLIFAGANFSTRSLSSATIGGVAATIHQQPAAISLASSLLISAIVPTGTTATVVLNMSSTVFAGAQLVAFVVDDDLLIDAAPTTVRTEGSGTTLTSGTLTIPAGAVVAGGTFFANGTAKTPITISNSDGDALVTAVSGNTRVAFYLNNDDGDDATFTTNWSGSFAASTLVMAWV